MNATKIQYEDDLKIPLRSVSDSILIHGHYRLFILRSTSREMPAIVYYNFFWIDSEHPNEVCVWKNVPKFAEGDKETFYTTRMTLEQARERWLKLVNSDDYIVTPVMYK